VHRFPENTSVKLARKAGNLALFSRHHACVGLSAGVAALVIAPIWDG